MSEEANAPSFEEWRRELQRTAPRRVNIDLTAEGAIRLSQIRQKPLELLSPPIHPATSSPMDLEIMVPDGGDHVLMWAGRFNLVKLDVDTLTTRTHVALGPAEEVAVVGTGVGDAEGLLELRLEDTRNVVVESIWVYMPETVRQLELVDAGLASWKRESSDIRLEGSIHLTNVRFDSPIKVNGPLVLTLDGNAEIEQFLDADQIEILRGNLTLTKHSPANVFRLKKGTTLTIGAGALAVGGRISGEGAVEVYGGLRGVVIDECGLIVRAKGFAVGLSGTPEYLQLDPGSAVVGSTKSKSAFLVPRTIRVVGGASLEMVDVQALGISDLAPLEDLESFSIQTAGRQSKRFEEAGEMSPSAIQGSRDETEEAGEVSPSAIQESEDETEETARAHFWRRLSAILADKGAQGEVQSRARAISAEMRRLSLRLGRERFWLGAYRKVGYGESISKPFGWHLLFSVAFIVALWLTDTDMYADEDLSVSYGFVRGLLQVVISPLAFFRFTERPYLASDNFSVLLTLISVIGVLMIFFSLAALRRVTKAE